MAKNRKDLCHYASILLVAGLAAIALVLEFKQLKPSDRGILAEIAACIEGKSLELTVITAGLYCLIYKLYAVKISRLYTVYSFVIAILWTAGKALELDNSLKPIFSSRGQTVKSLIFFIGSAILLQICFRGGYICME